MFIAQTKVNTVLTKVNTVLTKVNTVLTKVNTVLTKANTVLMKVNTAHGILKFVTVSAENSACSVTGFIFFRTRSACFAAAC
jgi:hypothetical protein